MMRLPIEVRSWGGPPTTRLLRLAKAANPVTVKHRHAQLARLYPQLRFPSEAEEATDSLAADHVYDTAARLLRSATRDPKRFRLVQLENRSYGFWRNAVGLQPFGTICLLIAIGFAVGALWVQREMSVPFSVAFLMALVIDVAALMLWLFAARPARARIAGEAYANALFDAADHLP